MDAVYIHTSCLTELGLDITPTKKKSCTLTFIVNAKELSAIQNSLQSNFVHRSCIFS